MQKKVKFLSVLSAGVLLSGCVTFPGEGPTPADMLEDTTNKNFIAKQIEERGRRDGFVCPVKVQMSEKGNRFISSGYRPSGARQMHLTIEFRKDLMATAHAALETEIGRLKDFKLISSDPATTSIAPVITDASADSNTYTFTYNISNVEVKDGLDTFTTILPGRRRGSNLKWFYVDVTVDVTLINNVGKQVFNFEKNVTYNKGFPTSKPDISVVKDAVRYAINQAMEQYAYDFAPPMYVDQTMSKGLFVRLSSGTNYGIREGQKIVFYRNYVQTLPTLPGQPPKTRIVQQQLATGTVGDRNAPVNKDNAWVYISGNDDPQNRKVFLWTSAKVAR